MANLELAKFSGPEDLAQAAANAWLDEVSAANRAGRNYCVALSGGRIAQNFFTAAAGLAQARKVPFDAVHFFWADERCVPPSDPESNFKAANELFLTPLHIAAENVHRLRGEEPPAAAAAAASEELGGVARRNETGQPVLDLILLGMGEDGHVASLFPNAPAQTAGSAVPFLVVEDSPKPPPVRISLSYEAIFAANTVWILVSGNGKLAALRESISERGRTPLARVIRARPAKIFSDINEI